jgi:hypothetical protein
LRVVRCGLYTNCYQIFGLYFLNKVRKFESHPVEVSSFVLVFYSSFPWSIK